MVDLPTSGQPPKISPRAQWQLTQEVIKNPIKKSNEEQASLTSVKVSCHESTIWHILGKNCIRGRVVRQKPLLTQENIKACRCRFSVIQEQLSVNWTSFFLGLWHTKPKIGCRCVMVHVFIYFVFFSFHSFPYFLPLSFPPLPQAMPRPAAAIQ